MTKVKTVPVEASGKMATAISNAVRKHCICCPDGVGVDNGVARLIWSAALSAAPERVADVCDGHRQHGIQIDPCCPQCPDPTSDDLLKALEPFARYYDLNDCHERAPDDALEVPISDLARAKRIVTQLGGAA